MRTNLRATFKGILGDWGHNVLLQHRTLDGESFQRKLELHTVRYTYPQKSGISRIAEYQPEGRVHTVDILYYFRHDASPVEGDRIYEYDGRYPELDSHGNPIQHTGHSTWLVDYALPLRGKRGQIVYYTVGATRERPV